MRSYLNKVLSAFAWSWALPVTWPAPFSTRPTDTILGLVVAHYQGGNEQELLQRAAALKAAGVTVVVLLDFSNEGAPSFDHRLAEQLAALGIPSFARPPARFPCLIAAAILGGPLAG